MQHSVTVHPVRMSCGHPIRHECPNDGDLAWTRGQFINCDGSARTTTRDQNVVGKFRRNSATLCGRTKRMPGIPLPSERDTARPRVMSEPSFTQTGWNATEYPTWNTIFCEILFPASNLWKRNKMLTNYLTNWLCGAEYRSRSHKLCSH
jgi:hypothetical protein